MLCGVLRIERSAYLDGKYELMGMTDMFRTRRPIFLGSMDA